MRTGWLAALSLLASLAAPGAGAAELKMLSAGAVEIGLVIAPAAVLDALARAGAIGSARVPVGKVGIGVAIRAGATAPDISSVETLKQELLSAESVVFNRASTGLYVETLLGKLGVADAVNAKATRYGDGASVMKHLLAGNKPREFGFAAITEIVLFKDQGLKLVGPLPASAEHHELHRRDACGGRARQGTRRRGDRAHALSRKHAGPAHFRQRRHRGNDSLARDTTCRTTNRPTFATRRFTARRSSSSPTTTCGR